jgi:hypothetical protein
VPEKDLITAPVIKAAPYMSQAAILQPPKPIQEVDKLSPTKTAERP